MYNHIFDIFVIFIYSFFTFHGSRKWIAKMLTKFHTPTFNVVFLEQCLSYVLDLVVLLEPQVEDPILGID